MPVRASRPRYWPLPANDYALTTTRAGGPCRQAGSPLDVAENKTKLDTKIRTHFAYLRVVLRALTRVCHREGVRAQAASTPSDVRNFTWR